MYILLLSLSLSLFFQNFFRWIPIIYQQTKDLLRQKKEKKELYVFAYAECACCSVRSLTPAPTFPHQPKKKKFVVKPSIKLPLVTKLIHRRKTEKTKGQN